MSGEVPITRPPKVDPVPLTLLYRPLLTADQRRLVVEAMVAQENRFRKILDRLPLDDVQKEEFREDIRTLRSINKLLRDTPPE